MQGHGLLSTLSTLLLLLTALSTASPGHDFEAPVRRQEKKPNSSVSASLSAAASTITSAAQTSSGALAAASSTAAATRSGSSTTEKSSGSKTTHATKTTSIDPRLPPGGIQLITPAVSDGVQYWRAGENVTFQWNYTSLSITPSAVDVLASCALNSATYTIAANMSVANATQSVVWDTGNNPTLGTNLPVASYTLIIYAADSAVTEVASAGALQVYNQYTFGMYTGQPYSPLNEFKCATCNGALSSFGRQAIGVLLGTAALTILSFSWFANGFGVFT